MPTNTQQTLAPIDIERELGVPVTQRGQPSLSNHVPKRFITKAEAESRGWSRYYIGDACRYGHQASRAVSNAHQCSDCTREREGEPPIYPRSKLQKFNKTAPKAAAPTPQTTIIATAPALKAAEPDATDKKFMTALADSRSFTQAAESAGTTVAQVQARLSFNATFKNAVNDLTERLGIPHPVQVSGRRELTPEEHEIFCRTWVDTGSQSRARAAIGISASQMHDALESSVAFREMVESAGPRAALALDDIAVDLSLAGNDKLLGKTLPAKLREQYTERLDLRVRTDALKPEEIDRRFQHLLKELFLLSPNVIPQIMQEAAQQALLQKAEAIDVECETVQDSVEVTQNTAARNTGAGTSFGASDEIAAAKDSPPRTRNSNDDLL